MAEKLSVSRRRFLEITGMAASSLVLGPAKKRPDLDEFLLSLPHNSS